MRVNIETVFGKYAAFISEQGIYKLFFPSNLQQADEFAEKVDKGQSSPNMQSIAEILAKELVQYHEGKLKEFTVPVDPDGENPSPFRRKVWDNIRKIPYGATCNYGELAIAAGSTSGRAIGGACSGNPVPVIIPCHRVIASNGTLGGFSGGKRLKKMLLELESSTNPGSDASADSVNAADHAE